MIFSSRSALFIALVLVIGVLGVVNAKKDTTADKRKQMQCGICHIITRNLENVRLNTMPMVNKGPYGMETEVMIDEALMHVCGISVESLKSLGFDDYATMEECNDLVFNNLETLENLMSKGISNPDKTCLEDIPVCSGLDPTIIPKPSVQFQAPKHPKDRQTASQKVVHDEL